MRTASYATASAALLAIAGAMAASANPPGAPAKSPPPQACPAAAHPVAPRCPTPRRAAHRHRAGHGAGGQYQGVSNSQAFMYGRQFQRDHDGLGQSGSVQVAAATPAAPAPAAAPPQAKPNPPAKAQGVQHAPTNGASGGHYAGGWGGRYGVSSRSYSYETGESGGGGYVLGEQNGRPFGWGWGGMGGWGGPPPDWYAEPQYWLYGRGGGYEVYRYVGRDRFGYLVWPGKPRRGPPPPSGAQTAPPSPPVDAPAEAPPPSEPEGPPPAG